MAQDQTSCRFCTFARGDLGERAVAPGLVVAADHEPVAGIGMQQHLVGDRHVVLDFAGNGDASWSGGTCRSASSGWASRLGSATRGASAAGSTRGRRRGGATRCDGTDHDVCVRRQRLSSGRRAIGLEDERGDCRVSVGSERARATRRHSGLDQREKFASRTAAPRVHEVATCEWRSFIASGEIGQVASGTIFLISRAPCRGLVRGERTLSGTLLRHHNGDC